MGIKIENEVISRPKKAEKDFVRFRLDLVLRFCDNEDIITYLNHFPLSEKKDLKFEFYIYSFFAKFFYLVLVYDQ